MIPRKKATNGGEKRRGGGGLFLLRSMHTQVRAGMRPRMPTWNGAHGPVNLLQKLFERHHVRLLACVERVHRLGKRSVLINTNQC